MLGEIDGIDEAYLFGSWAAAAAGEANRRAVADVDVLVLGSPDRTHLYTAVAAASEMLGREVQVTIRKPGWLEQGEGHFHDTILNRPMVAIVGPGSVLSRE